MAAVVERILVAGVPQENGGMARRKLLICATASSWWAPGEVTRPVLHLSSWRAVGGLCSLHMHISQVRSTDETGGAEVARAILTMLSLGHPVLNPLAESRLGNLCPVFVAVLEGWIGYWHFQR